jgi:hypothetical protein
MWRARGWARWIRSVIGCVWLLGAGCAAEDSDPRGDEDATTQDATDATDARGPLYDAPWTGPVPSGRAACDAQKDQGWSWYTDKSCFFSSCQPEETIGCLRRCWVEADCEGIPNTRCRALSTYNYSDAPSCGYNQPLCVADTRASCDPAEWWGR